MSRFGDLKRSWHERSSIDQLPGHHEGRYGTPITSITKLDGGVFRARREDGQSWIARVFPAARQLHQAEGDAEVLAFLEANEFPAERLADSDAVSVLDGQAVLVTLAITGTAVKASPEVFREMGDGLGRLAAYPELPGSVGREAGALHLWAIEDGGHANELDAAKGWLEEMAPSAAGKKADLGRSLLKALEDADDCSDLPHCLVHPDPALKNVLASKKLGPTWIDWTGAGRGPRISALANLFFHVVQSGGRREGVSEVIHSYREHVRLEPEEIARIAPAFRIRGLIYASFILASGKTTFPTVEEQYELSDQVAAHAASELAES